MSGDMKPRYRKGKGKKKGKDNRLGQPVNQKLSAIKFNVTKHGL